MVFFLTIDFWAKRQRQLTRYAIYDITLAFSTNARAACSMGEHGEQPLDRRRRLQRDLRR